MADQLGNLAPTVSILETADKGAVNGVASLDGSGQVPASQLGNASIARNNYVLVQSKSDLPTPITGVITLADNTSYEINGTIALGTDRIACGVSNIIYGVDKSNDILTYTGTGNMITSTNQDLTISKVTCVATGVGSAILACTGTNNNIEILENIFANSKNVGSIGGGFDILVFRNNLVTACDDGITIAGANLDLVIADNLFNALTSTCTAITITGTAVYHTAIISRNMFEIAATQTGLDISAGISFSGGGIIEGNVFEDGGTYLATINANSADWIIKAGTNVGLPGLFEATIPVANVVSSTTAKYATFSNVGQSFFVDTPDNLNPGSDTIEINLIVECKISDGTSWWYDLFNYTDGTFIGAPTYPYENNFNATASDLYEKAETGFVALPVADQGKSLGPTISGEAGGGSRTTTLLNAELKIKVYKA